MAREDDDQGRVPRWDAPLSDAALEQALLVVAVAGPAASPAQARAAHRGTRPWSSSSRAIGVPPRGSSVRVIHNIIITLRYCSADILLRWRGGGAEAAGPTGRAAGPGAVAARPGRAVGGHAVDDQPAGGRPPIGVPRDGPEAGEGAGRNAEGAVRPRGWGAGRLTPAPRRPGGRLPRVLLGGSPRLTPFSLGVPSSAVGRGAGACLQYLAVRRDVHKIWSCFARTSLVAGRTRNSRVICS